MTDISVVCYLVFLLVCPFVGVLLSYHLSKKKLSSEEIMGFMALGAIISLGVVGLGFPLFWIVIS